MKNDHPNIDEELAQAFAGMRNNINYLMRQVRQAAARGAKLDALLDCIGPDVPPLQRTLLAGVIVGASGLEL